MSERNRHGKREVAHSGASSKNYWQRYKAWLSGLNRGQRIRYRCLQAVTFLSVLIIVVGLALSAWIQMPALPDPSQGGNGEGGMGDVSFEGAEIPDVALSGRKKGIYTFLVAGKDVVSSATDTILLLSYDTTNKTIQGLNIPRDTMINTSANSKRINSVYARNRGSSDLPEAQRVEQGMEALKQEVAKITGITPDFYVLVEWDAVGELVEALGGVYFEVPFDMDYDDPYQDLHIHQEAGYRKLNGEDAMEVIRWRKNNTGPSGGDVARLEIQQDFLKAVATECLKPATLLKIPELARIFTENVATDLTVGNILALAQRAYGMDPDTGVNFETAPLADSFSYKGAALVTLDGEGILEIVNNGMNPYQRDIEARDLQLIYRNSNGSFGVTNSTLADPKMGQSTTSSSSSSSQGSKEEPEDQESVDDTSQENTSDQSGGEDGAQEGGGSQDGTQPGGDGTQGGTDGGQIGEINPDDVLPDPNQGVSQGGESQGGENPVAVLPQRPEAVEPAV